MKRLVQWGAGNIGRSFIGQVFSKNGYEVIFIDIDTQLIDLLNEKHAYPVVFTSQEGEERITVTGVSAIHGREQENINEAVLSVNIMATSVGKRVLPVIAPQIAEAVLYRYEHKPDEPLDIILAENVHNAAQYMEGLLKKHVPESFPLRSYLGLVETSIGKMVPIQTGDDPLEVKAEPYNTLIVDKDACIGEIPKCDDIKPVSPIQAYVERKLFIHNLGHAAATYVGYQMHPEKEYLAEVMQDPTVFGHAKKAMTQSAAVLRVRYPQVFTEKDLRQHIDDLLVRFKNKALGDTLYHVGRDLARKLRYDDRLMGAILLAEECNMPWDAIGRAYLAGFSFQARDPSGNLFPQDEKLLNEMENMNLEEKIRYASCLSESEIPQEIQEQVIARFASL